MKVVYSERHSRWAQAFVQSKVWNCRRGFENAVGHAVVDKTGQPVAGWIWHDWWPEAGTIEFSGASNTARWMTRKVLHDLFSYAFDEVGCQMVVTQNACDNTRLHRQLKAFGFTRYDVPRLFGRDKDGVYWTLTDDQWRASKFYYGKTKSAQAA